MAVEDPHLFEDPRFRLQRLAVRFRPTPAANVRSVGAPDVASVIDGLMRIGIYEDAFAYLENPELNHFEMEKILERFLASLGWRPLSEEQEFRFLTAVYAETGMRDDVAAYHAILRWMDDVGREMGAGFSDQFIADGIEAQDIYSCYYAYSPATGGDLIPSVRDPYVHDWSKEGDRRPKLVFAAWLAAHPHARIQNRPFDVTRLDELLN